MTEQIAKIGDNNPPVETPSEIDLIIEPFGMYLDEADNWLDGDDDAVKTEDQMKAVDDLNKQVKKAAKAIDDERKARVKPFNDQVSEINAAYNARKEKLKLKSDGLVKLVGGYKKVLLEKQQAERAAKAAEADRLAKEAAKAAQASDTDIRAKEAALEAEKAARSAQKEAKKADKAKVGGLRTVTKFEITDYKKTIHDIAVNDKEAIKKFCDDYARLNHRNRAIAGVEVWQEQEAF